MSIGTGEGLLLKDIARLSLTLMLICVVAGAGLAMVYAKTKPVIEERAREDALNAAKDAIPGAVFVEEYERDGRVFWVGSDSVRTMGAAMKVSSQGYGATPMEVMVGVCMEGRVTRVAILSHSETPGIGSRVANRSFLDRFSGSLDPATVDGITGATVSSGAVKSAVSEAVQFLACAIALEQCKAEVDLVKVADGTYEGQGQGMFGPIKVAVEVKDGKILRVSVLEQQETPSIAGPALSEQPKAIVDQQEVDVDVTAGATFTSKGVVEAVKNALIDAVR